MSSMTAQAEEAAPRPVASAADGAALIKHLLEVMDALLGTVEQETELVRAGKLAEAAKLEAAKAELSGMYVTDSTRIRASQVYLDRVTPGLAAELRKRHDTFRAVLQMNLTVLATAHAVSESIMRGVSSELARKATPQAYGASGRAMAPAAASMQPLTLSRVL
ncbi:MAG: hypothetical protein QOF91_2137 [Alphaproteobacteria bacterium]|jgi:hypothetical protein|nr:hypothetical protein [Alphaproteobacteria bacterium]